MPADRLFSPRAARSVKVTMLTDLEFRVWWQYVLSADDFGVMRLSVVDFQSANNALRSRRPKAIEMAIQQIIAAPLVLVFEHQGEAFICQPTWQTFQKVEYPRLTTHPKPPESVLAKCDEATQALFQLWPGGQTKRKKGRMVAEDSQNGPEAFGEHLENVPQTFSTTRASAPAKRLTANANGSRLPADAPDYPGMLATLKARYPASAVTGGHLTESVFFDIVSRDATAFPRMLANLETQIRGGKWADPKYIPKLARWLSEGQWEQRHDPPAEKSADPIRSWKPREMR